MENWVPRQGKKTMWCASAKSVSGTLHFKISRYFENYSGWKSIVKLGGKYTFYRNIYLKMVISSQYYEDTRGKKSSSLSLLLLLSSFEGKWFSNLKKGRKYWLLWTRACKLRRDCVRNWFVLLIKINYILSHQEGLKI